MPPSPHCRCLRLAQVLQQLHHAATQLLQLCVRPIRQRAAAEERDAHLRELGGHVCDHVGAAEMHLLVERAQLVVLALGRLSVGFSSCVLLSCTGGGGVACWKAVCGGDSPEFAAAWCER